MKKTGKVYLVGAGPGDIGLVSVRAMDLIGEADVIIYDKLIPDGILNEAKPDAELIYCGKQAGRHSMHQDGINRLLIEKARSSKSIVRLKGGDPFIFGRGGEEALELRKAGIPFEIVCGVSSGAAVPAYAGIPITHRGIATSVHFITGHEDPDKNESQVDYEALAKVNGTLVFFMGVGNLDKHIKMLIEQGKSADTPSAVIYYGCTPKQKTVTGKMSEIVRIAQDAQIKPPSIVVIGEVCSLRDNLNWYETSPLFGKSIVVTRATTQASKLKKKLNQLGAEVIELSSISIEKSVLTEDDYKKLRELKEYDWIFFTSQNGVSAFFEELDKLNMDSRSLGSLKIASIGSATSDELKKRGLIADLVPAKFTSEGLLETFRNLTEQERGLRSLLPRADIASDELPKGLRELGIEIISVDIYKTTITKPDTETINRVLEKYPDYFTFTSSSTVENTSNLLGLDKFRLMSKKSRFVSIGPVTSAKILELGADLYKESSISNINGLVDSIIEDKKEIDS